MKTTITIETDNRASLDKILDSFRKTKGVKKVERLHSERIQGVPVTREEVMEDIRCSEEDIKAGRTITNEELRKRIVTW
ncbi:hypothetical protein [Bacteroides sp. 51]|uniref:hypothetical protein n=1 Tax=Bacteroides sp. 51 TaxID=2302938 RepID=UPI0013D8C9F4|nr:hypothetical protein [Bacteroides sp. 51]NDV83993.1 hypothetical protein [Bacteroides sp. 51]